MVWVCDWLFFGMMFTVEPYPSTESEMVVHPAGDHSLYDFGIRENA